VTDQQPNAAANEIDPHILAYRATVAENGFMIAEFAADPETGTPPHAYTIGLASTRGFELAVNGMPAAVMHHALVELAGRAREKRRLTPADGLFVEGFIEGIVEPGYVLRLRKAHPDRAFPWIACVLDLAEQPTVWQAQFPSSTRLFPGDEGFDPSPYAQLDYSLPPRGSAPAGSR
jgi:hypothetical protein